MSKFEHLTKKQLSDYSVGTLDQFASEKAGRHLLNCEPCRSALSEPTTRQFRTALMLENSDVQQMSIGSMDSDWQDTYSAFLAFLRRKQTLALSGVALFLVLSIYLVTFIKKPWQPNPELDIARNSQADVTNTAPDISGDKDFEAENPPAGENPRGSRRDRVARTVRLPITNGGNEKHELTKNLRGSSGANPSGGGSGIRKSDISTTRGIPSKCGDLKPIDFEFAKGNGSITLKWKKVSNAVTYHLYISDDEEVLIDEYETVEQTTYVFKKSLDKDKVYKWKVVVLLHNGNKIVGTSNKFSLTDFHSMQNGSIRRMNAEVRCATNN